MFLNYNFRNYNYRLFLYVLLLNILGVLLIRSATNQDMAVVGKQIMGIAVGAFLYFKFLSSFYIRWSVRIIKILLKPACFILKNVVRIITIPVRSLKMYMKRRKDMGKKEAQG